MSNATKTENVSFEARVFFHFASSVKNDELCRSCLQGQKIQIYSTREPSEGWNQESLSVKQKLLIEKLIDREEKRAMIRVIADGDCILEICKVIEKRESMK